MRHARLMFIGVLVAALMFFLAGPAAAGVMHEGKFQIEFGTAGPTWILGDNDGFLFPGSVGTQPAPWKEYPQPTTGRSTGHHRTHPSPVNKPT